MNEDVPRTVRACAPVGLGAGGGRRGVLALAVATALAGAAGASRAADVTSSWFGGTGRWSKKKNWVNLPPGKEYPNNGGRSSTYDVVVGEGTVTLDRDITIQRLFLNGGTIDGPRQLTLLEGGTWTAGAIAGPGVATVAPGATFTISGAGAKLFAGRTLNNAGTVQFASGSVNSSAQGSVINNQAGALFDVRGEGSLGTLTAPGTFNNAGTFLKGAAGTFTTDWTFNSTGVVQVQAGTLDLSGGGTGSGSFVVTPGATLDFHTYSLGPTASVSGGGTVLFTGSTLDVNINGPYDVPGMTRTTDGTVNYNGQATAGDLDVAGGTVNVPGSLTVNNLTNSGGTLNVNGGVLTADAGALQGGTTTVSGATGRFVVRTLTISGGTNFVAAGAQMIVGTRDDAAPGAGLRARGTALVTAEGALPEVLSFVGPSSPTLTLASDPATPGMVLLGADVVCNVPSGTAMISSAGPVPVAGTVDLGGARAFTISDGTAAVDMEVSARLTNGSLRKSGPGTLRLAAENDYAGGTTVAGGVLEVGHPSALGSGGVTLTGGTLALKSDAADTSYSFPLRAAPADSITLDVGRPSGGTAKVRVPSLTLGTRLDVNGAGSTLAVTGPVALQADVTVENSADVSFEGSVGGPFRITKAGAGSLSFAGSAANTYGGGTVVNGGALLLAKAGGAAAVPGALRVNGPASVRLEADQQIADTTAVTVNAVTGAASLDLNGHAETIGSLDNGGSVVTGAGALAVGAVTGGGTLTVSPGGSLAADFVRQGGLNVGAGATATVRARGAGGATSVVRSLGIAGSTDAWTGKLELSDAALVVDYATGAASPLATLSNQIKSGRAGGAWNGNGITSAPAATTAGTTLGVAESSQVLGAGGGMFEGQSVDATAVLVRWTLSGDANLDGAVNGADFAVLASNFGRPGGTWYTGDFNYDDVTNGADFAAIAQNFGKAVAGAAGAGVSAADWRALEAFGGDLGADVAASVPEPAGAAVMSLAAAGLLFRRRRGRRD